MKKVLVSCIALLCIILYGCQTESLNLDETAKTIEKEKIDQKSGDNPEYGASNSEGNELIILYPEGTTEAEKALKRLEYEVEDYKECKCGVPNLELWIFNKDF